MIYIVMGVCGSGKTTVGALLARSFEIGFVEGDDYHSPENIEKMQKGESLTDEDRAPWLARLSRLMREWDKAGLDMVLACSALKKSYRDALASGVTNVEFIYLRGLASVIRGRMAGRADHFMPPSLIESQIEILEEPEGAIAVDISAPPPDIVTEIRNQLSRKRE